LWYKGAYKEVDAIMEMRYREEEENPHHGQ
jgi:hypothetical protein